MGYDYYYIDDGNDINKVISTLNQIKGIDHPTVVHVMYN